MDSKALSQERYTQYAQGYVTSQAHAKGAELARLVEIARPQPGWVVLDVATGGGHTALAFAPHVMRAVATDLTPRMLEKAEAHITSQGVTNVEFRTADAEDLPFDDETFDLVTCRIAPHHFDSIPDFLAEVHRVLKPGGLFAVVDNVVPEGSVGDYVNAFERFRDPSHLRAWTMEEWRAALTKAGFTVGHEEQLYKQMEFKSWAARHDANMQAFLRAMLAQLTPEVKAVLEPKGAGPELTFRLCEGLFIAKRV
jgi:ubiquinone/menaquinone biosynthesis C-methylase UbiE